MGILLLQLEDYEILKDEPESGALTAKVCGLLQQAYAIEDPEEAAEFVVTGFDDTELAILGGMANGISIDRDKAVTILMLGLKIILLGDRENNVTEIDEVRCNYYTALTAFMCICELKMRNKEIVCVNGFPYNPFDDMNIAYEYGDSVKTVDRQELMDSSNIPENEEDKTLQEHIKKLNKLL